MHLLLRNYMKHNLIDTTFVIPLRIDSLERVENILFTIKYLDFFFETNTIILESDIKKNSIINYEEYNNVEYIFLEDIDPIFYRTRYINVLSNRVKTDFIAVWDSDVVVHPNQILLALDRLRDNTYDFVFPYDGNFLDTGAIHRIEFLKSNNIDYLFANSVSMTLPYISAACGGGFFAKLCEYIECGGENENFYGWGQEDGERVKRWQILEKRVVRVKGPMFHLYHPRGTNSNYLSKGHRERQIEEFYRISRMTKEQLQNEILLWKKNRNPTC